MLPSRRRTLPAPLDHFNARGVAATQELVALLDPQAGESCWTSAAVLAAPRAGRDAVRLHGDRRGCDGRVLRGRARLNAAWGHGPGADRRRHRPRVALPGRQLRSGLFPTACKSIADKAGSIGRRRVLRPRQAGAGPAACGPNGPPDFPVSWASGPAQSFLATDGHPPRPDGCGFCRRHRCAIRPRRSSPRKPPGHHRGEGAASRHAGVDR